ncbi:NUDIX domain-containing protein [Candidatus Kaiserbacteria bacterium]|nr:MAG: NUDIX domain-containing protein [Candidatus Kaiserbacteria bacterium]
MAHIHEKIDFTVEVFVVYQGKVLLRKHDKYDIWISVGGHVELDEDPNEAAIREVKEEVGLDVTLFDNREYFEEGDFKELIAPVSLNRHKISDTHEHISLIYFAQAKTDAVIPEKETDEWRWLTKEEIEDFPELREQVRFYALKALN